MKTKFGIKEVVAIGIGTALFVVLTNVQIPFGIIPNTALQSRVAVLWWSWVFPDAVYGIIIGLFAKKYAIKAGGFDMKAMIHFNVTQVIANAVAWILVAPVLDILIYAEPVNLVFTQGVFACIGNVVVAAVLGTALAFAYSKLAGSSSSLTKED